MKAKLRELNCAAQIFSDEDLATCRKILPSLTRATERAIVQATHQLDELYNALYDTLYGPQSTEDVEKDKE